MPKISVIMPAYNAEKYIREAIDSILGQTFTDFEFIIIDDASSDSTVSIIESYDDERIRFFKNDENMGVARTLNRGLEMAKGEYIARMDSDDISLPKRFEKQVKFLDDNKNVAVCGSAVELFGAVNETRSFSKESSSLKVDLLFSSCIAHPSVMMRSDVIGTDGYMYDSDYTGVEDYELWCRVSQKHKLFALCDVLLKYRIHPRQVTGKRSKEDVERERSIRLRNIKALGLGEDTVGMNDFLSFCEKNYSVSRQFILNLNLFFEKVKKANYTYKIYCPGCLDATFRSVNYSLLDKIPVSEAILLAGKCRMNVAVYFSKRCFKKIRYEFFKVNEKNSLSRKLKCKKFTIISNNCWGGSIYSKYGLKYRTPTVGLYILGNDFVKMCSDWQNYFSKELKFIPWEDASYHYALKESKPFPVGLLGDVEIYFMHYSSEQEAKEKWERRVARIEKEHMLFKLSQREKCSKEDVAKFVGLPLKNKICFSYEEVSGAIVVPELEGYQGDETPVIGKYYDEISMLNSL